MLADERMYLVTTREQVSAIDAEFVGQMLRRGALCDAAQDLNDRRTAIAGLPQMVPVNKLKTAPHLGQR